MTTKVPSIVVRKLDSVSHVFRQLYWVYQTTLNCRAREKLSNFDKLKSGDEVENISALERLQNRQLNPIIRRLYYDLFRLTLTISR